MLATSDKSSGEADITREPSSGIPTPRKHRLDSVTSEHMETTSAPNRNTRTGSTDSLGGRLHAVEAESQQPDPDISMSSPGSRNATHRQHHGNNRDGNRADEANFRDQNPTSTNGNTTKSINNGDCSDTSNSAGENHGRSNDTSDIRNGNDNNRGKGTGTGHEELYHESPGSTAGNGACFEIPLTDSGDADAEARAREAAHKHRQKRMFETRQRQRQATLQHTRARRRGEQPPPPLLPSLSRQREGNGDDGVAGEPEPPSKVWHICVHPACCV